MEIHEPEGWVLGALCLPLSRLETLALLYLKREQPVLLYCCSGSRGAQAACILTSKGHKVYNLVGGTEAWKSHKLQVK